MSPKNVANRHILPACSCVTKNLFISDGHERGCFLFNLKLNPSNKLPLEKATFANLAVDTRKLFLFDNISFSIKLFDAPIIFTGLAALSVETLKKYFGGFSSQSSRILIMPKTLFLINASTEIPSFSDLTCLCAEKFAMISQLSNLNIFSNVLLSKFTG